VLTKGHGIVLRTAWDRALLDVGQMAVFLASDMARNTTGQALFVDGGYNIMGLMDGTVEVAT
jgi:enoyl-[acyl-carrier-protein] reductase (NADH)